MSIYQDLMMLDIREEARYHVCGRLFTRMRQRS